jgi:hypothetical protein
MAKILCSICGHVTDKGVKSQAGQDDSGFICKACQIAKNKLALSAAAPTIVLDGDK